MFLESEILTVKKYSVSSDSMEDIVIHKQVLTYFPLCFADLDASENN